MLSFVTRLFSSEGFMPHGHCYLWLPEVVWLHVIADALVALSYTTIPFTLSYFVRKRRDIPFTWMFKLFSFFIIACGATHYMAIYTLWHPAYRLSGVVKALTAVASVPTAYLLLRLVPRALAIPSPNELRRAHERLSAAHRELKAANRRLAASNAELEAFSYSSPRFLPWAHRCRCSTGLHPPTRARSARPSCSSTTTTTRATPCRACSRAQDTPPCPRATGRKHSPCPPARRRSTFSVPMSSCLICVVSSWPQP